MKKSTIKGLTKLFDEMSDTDLVRSYLKTLEFEMALLSDEVEVGKNSQKMLLKNVVVAQDIVLSEMLFRGLLPVDK
jgi:hypothetical protein